MVDKGRSGERRVDVVKIILWNFQKLILKYSRNNVGSLKEVLENTAFLFVGIATLHENT